MSSEATLQSVTQMVINLLADNKEDFLVEIKINPTNNIKIFLDADNGISIDKCVKYNRALYKQIEETLFADGNFSLEVSSPGIDEPLKLQRQYLKNTGRFVEVVTNDEVVIEGKLLTVDEEEVVVEVIKGKGKKAEVLQNVIPFNNIKSTKVQIQF